jgi:HPr kinase/phosphorylase
VKHKTVHATLVRLMARGIVIMGESGSGKSRLALSLLYEGARLVADDVVELTAGPSGLRGRPPDRLRGLIEIRGVGIIDVAAAMGRPFVIEETAVDLAVRLMRERDGTREAGAPRVGVVRLLGCEIPEIRVPAGIDVHGLLCVIGDVILGGSGASAGVARLAGPSR